MFANTFQSGFISVFYSSGSNPLLLWDKKVKNGHIRRIVDDVLKSLVLEIAGTNVATTYITCPIKPRASLGIKLPFLVMIIKNLKKYFSFEVQILDDQDMHRRFRISNFQSTTKVSPFCTTMPIKLNIGWNQVQFNLADFTKRAYGTTYLETTRIQIHANICIRRIYFSDMLYEDDELPKEYRMCQRKTETELKKRLSEEKAMRKSLEQEIPSGALPSPVVDNTEIVQPILEEIIEAEVLKSVRGVTIDPSQPQIEPEWNVPQVERPESLPETAISEVAAVIETLSEETEGAQPATEAEGTPATTQVPASEAVVTEGPTETAGTEQAIAEAPPEAAPISEAAVEPTPSEQPSVEANVAEEAPSEERQQ